MPKTTTTYTPGQSQIIVVKIEDVDMTNRLVHAFDKSKSRIQVSFRDIPGGGYLRIPDQGERWTAVRVGWTWRLTGRLSSSAEQAEISTLLGPGDGRIYNPGTLYIDSNEVVINGRPLGTTVFDQFHPSGSFSSVVLSSIPSDPNTVMVFLSGLLVEPSAWNLNGRTLNFVASESPGVLVVYYQTIIQAYDDSTTVVGTARISGIDGINPAHILAASTLSGTVTKV